MLATVVDAVGQYQLTGLCERAMFDQIRRAVCQEHLYRSHYSSSQALMVAASREVPIDWMTEPLALRLPGPVL